MYRSQITKIQYYELRRTDAEIPKDGRPEYDLLRDYQTPRDSTRDDFLLFSCANLVSLVALGRFGVEKIQSLTSMVSNSVCHGLKGNHASVKKYLSFQIWVKNGES